MTKDLFVFKWHIDFVVELSSQERRPVAYNMHKGYKKMTHAL